MPQLIMPKDKMSAFQDPKLTCASRHIIEVLEAAGYEAWLVGGCVRDALLGIAPHDFDITTSATWQQSAQVLRAADIEVHETGTAHGTVSAYIAGELIEITSYRVEGTYSDHRHPDIVRFVNNVCDDLARRDFTINAMAWHPNRGLLDPFGGVRDLEQGCIRAVGDPHLRFAEDALRLLRAIRFSSRFAFPIESRTKEALICQARGLIHVANERIGAELLAIVQSGQAARAFRENPQLMVVAIPELAPMFGFKQFSRYHRYDVYEHTLHVMEAVEEFCGGVLSPELAWSALLHDVGKPATFNRDAKRQGHFFGHPQCGAGIARKIMRRLALPKSLIRDTVALIRLHDWEVYANTASIRQLLARLEKASPAQAPKLAFELLCLKRADACAKTRACASYVFEIDKIEQLLRTELSGASIWRVGDLAIGGSDLIALGYEASPLIKRTLEDALLETMAGRVANTKEELLAWADTRK